VKMSADLSCYITKSGQMTKPYLVRIPVCTSLHPVSVVPSSGGDCQGEEEEI
jgi:hypothetical protein